MKKNDRHELEDWLKKLKESEKIIIVEGSNDKLALFNIGIQKKQVQVLNDAVFTVAEKVAKHSKQAIILTDLDKEGKKLYSNLKRNLNRIGVHVDTFFREFLFRNSDLSHIEGIDTFFKNLRRKQP
ncbi:toprim domain-containing protein [Candidatus Woesearchaeota archaeon]|nr:toprim domain-containing protein [Candidatus Woesearchaeota archaeon]